EHEARPVAHAALTHTCRRPATAAPVLPDTAAGRAGDRPFGVPFVVRRGPAGRLRQGNSCPRQGWAGGGNPALVEADPPGHVLRRLHRGVAGLATGSVVA